MNYRKFGNTIVARFDRGEEVLEQIKIIAEKENILLAKIDAIGATDNFTIGVLNVPEKKYYEKTYTGEWEIVSLHGNISTMDGKYYCHMHMGAGNNDGFVGGHLNKAVISATCEMFITILDGKVDRKKCETTGINVWEFEK